MIEVTDIGGNRLYINCDLIERMTTAPDTRIFLLTGANIVAKERPEEIVEKIIAFRRRCGEWERTGVVPPVTPPPGDAPEPMADDGMKE